MATCCIAVCESANDALRTIQPALCVVALQVPLQQHDSRMDCLLISTAAGVCGKGVSMGGFPHVGGNADVNCVVECCS
jgi:hypothetical protein